MAPPRFGGLTDTSTAAFEVVATSGAPGSTALGARTATGPCPQGYGSRVAFWAASLLSAVDLPHGELF